MAAARQEEEEVRSSTLSNNYSSLPRPRHIKEAPMRLRDL